MPTTPPQTLPRRALRLAWRVLRGVLLALAVIVIWIEEFGWQPLARWAAKLAQWPPLARLEARVRAAPPRVALALFLIPAVLLFPVKVAALWLIHKGQAVLGLTVIAAAKVLGTAFVGRLFVLCESQLMQFAWLARVLAWWRELKARVQAALRRSVLWRGVRSAKRWLRNRLQRSKP